MNLSVYRNTFQEKKNQVLKNYKNQKSSLSYLAVNVSMAMLGFVKSYITMRFLSFEDVGLLALMQSVTELVAFFQLGLLSGGFRMQFITPDSVKKRINNILFSYFGILGAGLTIGVVIYTIANQDLGRESILLMLGGLIGIFGLARTWLSNTFIAQQRLDALNKINVISTLLSFLFIFLIPFYGLVGSILLLLSQPLFFIGIIQLQNKKLLPDRFVFDKNLVRKLLKIGFIPFLAGLLLKSQDQIERWGIFNSIGLEELGKYNLAIIYASIFSLVPVSIHSIFFSKVMLQYKIGNIVNMNRMLWKYAIILILYALLAFLLTFLLLPPIVEIILPKYIIGIPYVWLIMPFLFTQLLTMPLDLKYDAFAKLKMKLVSYTLATVIFSTLIFIIVNIEMVELKYFPLAKGLSSFCFILINYGLYFAYYKRKKLIP